MASHNQKLHHITRIDALRGIAVLGMMIAHALFFFHNHSIDWISSIEQLFNTTVLTGFVFISGLSLSRWLDIHAHEPTHVLIRPAIRRTAILYLVYAVTAIVAVATVVPPPTLTQFLYGTLRALTLLHPPNFTEYLPLFILLVAITLPFRTLFRWTRQSLLLTIIVGAFSYAMGLWLYPLSLAPIINELKQLVAGGFGVMRFPLLFYFPIFLLGLWWQHQTDHAELAKKIRAMQNGLIAATGIFAVLSIIAARYYTIPLVDPAVRWPPSVAFLAIGLSAAATLYLTLPVFGWIKPTFKSLIVYFGRDSIDLWMNHLIILFVYRKFFGLQSGNAAFVIVEVIIVIILAMVASSVHLTNRITFPFHIALQGSTRFRRRYTLIVLVAIILLLLPPGQSKKESSASGNTMLAQPVTIVSNLPKDTRLLITTDRQWATSKFSKYSNINISLRAVNYAGTPIPVSPQHVKLHVGPMTLTPKADQHTDGSLAFTLSALNIPTGTYMLTATVPTLEQGTAVSNAISLSITEPLLVAWTFDWEGWDVPDPVLTAIDALETPYRKIPFTHFVSARTFLPDVLPATRRQLLSTYLQTHRSQGDEVALHMHMHYDFVQAAGLTPRTTNAWGLRTSEGYDIPATEYTPDEFGMLLEFSKKLMTATGLPDLVGYRAGGWFINTQLLNTLKAHGFAYDSSGRDLPKTGAFSVLPWRLQLGAQPYHPSITDQNKETSDKTRILEIPDNGVTTYESTVSGLIARSKAVYTSGVLTTPKTLIYTSHPQFADREFATIPHMLAYFDGMSLALDRGPVVYVTMSEIYSLWTSLE